MSKKVNYQDVLSRVVRIWVFCYGAVTLQVVAGYFLNHILLPYVGFLLILGIVYLGNTNLKKSAINCSMMTHYTVYVLAASGVVMLLANFMNTNFITNRYSEFSQQNYPFHACFIVYPVATLIYGIAILRRGKPQYCKSCRTASEFSLKEGLRRNVLHNEAKVQILMAFGISLLLTVISYVYYFYYYSSGDSYRRYSPDVFFMYILPAVIYCISVAYVLSRFFSVEFEISLNSTHEDVSHRSSHIRFMVVWRDKLLLRDVVGDGLSSMWDTPADITVDTTNNITMWEAEKAFKRLYGDQKFSLKRLFFTNHAKKNYLHCAAFIDDSVDEANTLGGEWLTLRDVDMMLNMGLIARPFAIELHRVFTITMAWKTYDREGRRLYPIKNYRPTFRLRDFKDWDVDYEDQHWMEIARDNQDKPFYNLRRKWRQYVTQTVKKWQ